MLSEANEPLLLAAGATPSLPQARDQRWQALAQATGQIAWSTDAAGNGLEISAWSAFTGLIFAETHGVGWLAAMHPADLPASVHAWRAALRAKAPFVFENRVRRHDGVYRMVQHRGVPILDAQGKIREWVGLSVDVTESRQMERERLLMVSIVSHELKTPLTGLKTRTQLMRRRLKRGQAVDDDSLEQTELGIDKMTRLINDLVDASRFDTDNLELDLQTCDLADLAQRIAAEQSLATGRAINVTATAPALALADPFRVAQVIHHLLANAVRYSQLATPIILRVQPQDGMVRVAISDQGPGIPPEAQSHIFERFYRVRGIPSYGGTNVGLGVGLYISQQLIQRQGGAIGADTAVGQGSTFWFTLPSAPHTPAAFNGASHDELRTPLTGAGDETVPHRPSR